MKKVSLYLILVASLLLITGCIEDTKMAPPSSRDVTTSSTAPTTTEAPAANFVNEDDTTLACRMSSESFGTFLKAYANITGQSGVKTITSSEYLLTIKNAKADLTIAENLITDEILIRTLAYAKQSLVILENGSLTHTVPSDGEFFFLRNAFAEYTKVCQID
jgi:PBP1b-binding outer membrane lipoprotein LpoB